MKQVLSLAGGQSDQLVGNEACHDLVLTPLWASVSSASLHLKSKKLKIELHWNLLTIDLMDGPPTPLDYPPLHLHALTKVQSLLVETWHHWTVRRDDGPSDKSSHATHVRCPFESSLGPHTTPQLSISYATWTKALTSSLTHSHTPTL
jgi:hypothetical protein